MLVYLTNAHRHRLALGQLDHDGPLLAAIREGAVLRICPKAMTIAIVLAGLVPML